MSETWVGRWTQYLFWSIHQKTWGSTAVEWGGIAFGDGEVEAGQDGEVVVMGKKKVENQHVCEMSHGRTIKALGVREWDVEQSSELKISVLKPQSKDDKVDHKSKS